MGQPSLELVSGDWHAFLQPPRASRRLLRSGCCSRLSSSICICSCGRLRRHHGIQRAQRSCLRSSRSATASFAASRQPAAHRRDTVAGIEMRVTASEGTSSSGACRPAVSRAHRAERRVAPPVCHLVSAIVRPNTSHRAIRSRRDVARVGARPRAVAARLVVDVATHRAAWVRVSRPGESAPGGRDELVG
jgi:hypothetical protein